MRTYTCTVEYEDDFGDITHEKVVVEAESFSPAPNGIIFTVIDKHGNAANVAFISDAGLVSITSEVKA